MKEYNGYEILPCPFCGGEGELHLPDDKDGRTYVWCPDCGATGTKFFTVIVGDNDGPANLAITMWDSRK